MFDNRIAGLGMLGHGTLGSLGIGLDPDLEAMHEEIFRREAEESEYGGFPWNVYSSGTKSLQNTINNALARRGYSTIKADGVLGPTTCAAARALEQEGTGFSGPPNCKSYGAAPTCVNTNPPERSKCTGAAPAPPPKVGVPPAPPPAVVAAPLPPAKPKLTRAKMIGGAFAVTAVLGAGYYVGKQKGWFG